MADNDWQVNRTPQDCSKYLLENELYTDVEFQVGDEGTLIKAHKIIMANRSPVFEKMFYGLLAETRFPIKIMDVEPEAFRALLRYCYYEELEVAPEIVLATMYAAKKYFLPKLEDSCRDVVILNLEPENIWEIYTWSMFNQDEKLHCGCGNFFGRSVTLVAQALKSDSFLQIPKNVLQNLLEMNAAFPKGGAEMNEILIAEIEVFKACNAWSEAECLRQKLKPSGKNKRKVLGDCLFLIRFPTLLEDDLVNVVCPSDILNGHEKLHLRKNLKGLSKKLKHSDKFLYDLNYYRVPIDPKEGAVRITEFSQSQNRKVRYNSIKIRPAEKMILSGVVLLGRHSICHKSLHEVIVEGDVEGKMYSKEVLANVFPFIEYTVKLLEFKDVYLKANCLYTVKVGYLCRLFDDPEYPSEPVGRCYVGKVKPAEALNLNIVDRSSNLYIKYIRVHLV